MSFILEKFKSFNSKNAIVFEDRIYTYEEFVKQIDLKNIDDSAKNFIKNGLCNIPIQEELFEIYKA